MLMGSFEVFFNLMHLYFNHTEGVRKKRAVQQVSTLQKGGGMKKNDLAS